MACKIMDGPHNWPNSWLSLLKLWNDRARCVPVIKIEKKLPFPTSIFELAELPDGYFFSRSLHAVSNSKALGKDKEMKILGM